MLLGILSDTHGDVARTRQALQLLLEAGAEHLIHCGDIESEEVLYAVVEALHGRDVEMRAVLGNVDSWVPGLRQFPSTLGIHLALVHRFDLDGLHIGVAHGHNAAAIQKLKELGMDLLFTGHTHIADDHVWEGGLRVINPGAVKRGPASSVALFDTTTGKTRFLPLT